MTPQGLYVVQFPDKVKIGISTNLPERYRDHVKAGATHGTTIPTGPIDYRRLLRIEDAALVAAEDHGRRLRSGRILLESFAGLPFPTAVELVLDAATAELGGPFPLVPAALTRPILPKAVQPPTAPRPRQTPPRAPIPARDEGEVLLTAAEVAAQLDVSPRTVVRMASDGRLTRLRVNAPRTRIARYRLSEVRALSSAGV